MAKYNAHIYGVADRIEFIVGDFFDVAPTLKNFAEVVFLSPPWGGPEYADVDVFDLETMIPVNGKRIFEVANSITPNVAYFLPKNVNVEQVMALGGPGSKVEMEQNILNSRIKTVTAYFGDLIK